MAFEEIQERLKSEWQQTVDRLNENATVQSLKDRYESLSPFAQKAVTVAGIIGVLLVLTMMPYNTYLNSSDSLSQFEGKRSLIRDLLRTYKESKENPVSVNPPSISEVQSRMENILTASQILPEQRRGMNTSPTASLVKANLVEGVVTVTLGQLNLRQIINLAGDFSSIEGSKLKDLKLDASSKDPRYYDATFSVLVFKGLSPADEPPPLPDKPGKKGGR